MTCIVGIEHEGRVWIGGDIQGTSDNYKMVHTQPKVFKKSGVVFGYTGSYRYGQLIEHSLDDFVVPDDDKLIYEWLVKFVVEGIVTIIGDYEVEPGSCLLGVKDQLWCLQQDYSVLRSTDGYCSEGAGQEYAAGAMKALLDGENDPKKVIRKTMEITHHFCPSVGKKATIINT